MHPSFASPAEPAPELRRVPSRLRERLIFLLLPLVVLAGVLGLLWFGGFRQDRVPSSIRDEAVRNCSVAQATETTRQPGTPEFERCVSDWITILWD